MSSATPRTARTSPVGVSKETARSRISRSRGLTPGPGGSCGLSRIEGVADGLPDEDQEGQGGGTHEEAGDPEPRRLEGGLAVGEELAEGRRAGGHGGAAEVGG